MSDLSSAPSLPSSFESHLPLVLAPDAQADAAVMAADAVEFVTRDGDGEGDAGGMEELRLLGEMEGEPEGRLAARNTYETPESRLEARTTTLEQALDAVALEEMTEVEVAELESGDAARMAAVLKVKETPAAGRSDAEDGSGLNRVSIKALPPALRLKLVTAISRTRDGGDFEQALREVFPLAAQAQGGGDGGGAHGGQAIYQNLPGGVEDPGGPAAAPDIDPGRPEARPTGVLELETRLADVRAEYDRAKAEYDPRAQDLLEEMMEVKLDLREAQRAQAGFMQGQRTSYERAMAEHADLMADAESPFLDLCDMTISLAERNNDPILTVPDWPERIAKQVRGRFFTGAAARSVARSGGGRQQQQVPVPPAPQQRVRLPGSPVGNGFAPGSITPETALAEFDQLAPEEQEAALAEIARVTDGRRRR